MPTPRSFDSRLRSLRTAARRAAGFTLIEIMVVIVILGILAAIIVPNMFSKPDEARVVAAKSDIKNIEAALNMYKLDNFYYPSTSQGLEALVTKPSGDPPAKNWRQPYLPRMPKDPWGNPYIYIQPGQHGEFDLMSYGRDGKPGGEGPDADIGNWDVGG
jgi:general secretion pathway protein G